MNIKKNHSLIILVTLIIVILIIVGLIIYKSPPKEITGRPCMWVYKTNGNYFGLQGIFLLDDGRIQVLHGITQMELEDSYFGFIYGCAFPENFAFVNHPANESAYDYAPDYFLNNIVDDDPFTEFYLCDGTSAGEDVNEIIRNNELDVKCEKKK